MALWRVPAPGSLRALTGLTQLRPLGDFRRQPRRLMPTTLGLAGAVLRLPPAIALLDVRDNGLFAAAPVAVEAPGLRYTGIARGAPGRIAMAPGSVVNLHQNTFRCPIPRPDGLTLLVPRCAEDFAMFGAIAAGFICAILGMRYGFSQRFDPHAPARDAPRTERWWFAVGAWH